MSVNTDPGGTMSEMDPEPTQGGGEEAPEVPETPAADGPSERESEKEHDLRKENRSLREQLRRAQLTTDFGPDIVEAIHPAIPIADWRAEAEKLKAMRGTPEAGPTETDETPAAAPEEPTPDLASVVRPQAPGPREPAAAMTAMEIYEQSKADLSAAEANMRAKYGNG